MALYYPQRNIPPLDPDEVFLDSGNLPRFEEGQLEGVFEQPISNKVILALGGLFFIFMLIAVSRIFMLQIVRGDEYSNLAKNNSLEHSIIFTERGVIYDRLGTELAWNAPARAYTTRDGFGHLLGYVSYPDTEEIKERGYHPEEFIGRDGAEKYFDAALRGRTGLKVIEVSVNGATTSESVLRASVDGENVMLSIDAELESAFFGYIESLAHERGFQGGSGVIMDTRTGEILAVTSYPEYSSRILSEGSNKDIIGGYQRDQRKPFLNRAFNGLYTPGSIFKPIVAIGALNEGVIASDTVVHTTGSIEIQNPYDPSQSTIFRDWKNHGNVDMRDAIAFSSNAYFFTIGGGFGNQSGLGISDIERYARMFGLGEKTGSGVTGEEEGLIPTPAWKEDYFNEPWRLGDTYNTSIGQYNLQVTPIQMVRAIAAIANGGELLTPTFIMGDKKESIRLSSIKESAFVVVRDGMREAVKKGTASGLSLPGVFVAAKTGTAEIDFSKTSVNSWVTGFFPYEDPKYAFVVVMEKGPRENFIGGVFVMRQLLEWMTIHRPEYLEG